MMQQQRPMMQQQMPMQRPPTDGSLTSSTLANAPPGMQKQMLGEKIFPLIARLQPEMAGKITGMMLEMDNSELLILLESPEQLKMKVDEALRVLEAGRPLVRKRARTQSLHRRPFDPRNPGCP